VLAAGSVAVGVSGVPAVQAQTTGCSAIVEIANVGFEEPVQTPSRALPASLPGWTVSGEVDHWGVGPTFDSGSQYVHLTVEGGSISQTLDGVGLGGETVTFQITSIGSGTITLGGEWVAVSASDIAVSLHTVTLAVPANAPDALVLTLAGARWFIDGISGHITGCATPVLSSQAGQTVALVGEPLNDVATLSGRDEATASSTTS
jgi:hypothetical protein